MLNSLPILSATSTITRTESYEKYVMRAWLYLSHHHLHKGMLVGPDPIGRLNLRVWRFVKNYVNPPWLNNSHVFMQAQGYWVLANWSLFNATGQEQYRSVALACAEAIAAAQCEDGSWLYPSISRERTGLVATVEGAWASIGLLIAFMLDPQDRYIQAVYRWRNFVDQSIGYQLFSNPQLGECSAVNYYWQKYRGMVPNNATLMLNMDSLAYKLTNDPLFIRYYQQTINFIETSMLDSGEIAYIHPNKPHYLCYQYNAYEFLDLVGVYHRDRGEQLRLMLQKIASFLASGQRDDGGCKYNCSKDYPDVVYYTAALGNAYLEAYQIGFGEEYAVRSARAFEYAATRQQQDGSWIYSEKDCYGLLSDRQRYPRYQVMMLYHLAQAAWPDLRGIP